MYKNMSMIDVKKQAIVEGICRAAQQTPIVEKVIIFGSTARKECTDDSDVDICYVLSCDTRNLDVYNLSRKTSKICDHNCDIFFYDLIGSNLKSEIDRTGVVVYESKS